MDPSQDPTTLVVQSPNKAHLKLLTNTVTQTNSIISHNTQQLGFSSGSQNPRKMAETEAVMDSENGTTKRAREDLESEAGEKKAKMEVEKETDGKQADGKQESTEVVVGPKKFGSSVDMFDYFYKILHAWPANLDLNKYEHIVLLELLKKGHLEAERKIGKGVKSFQVRFHPQFKSRCFFLVREDDAVDDFSFRKCVHHILPLPEDFQVKHDVNKALRGKGGGGGRGRGRGGRGRGGR